jgi:Brp/Blh family beta-carotene 15,15'-monooxygenase
VGILLVLVDWNAYQFSEQLQVSTFLIGIVVFGIPHGGADRLIASKNFRLKGAAFSKLKFNCIYLGCIVLFSLLLLCFPISGFVLFLLLSAFHFGESDLHPFGMESLLGKLVTFNYGLLILGVIFLPNFQQVQTSMATFGLNTEIMVILTFISDNNLAVLVAISGLFVMGSLIYFLLNKDVLRQNYLQLIPNLLLLPILYKLPLLLSFSFYFLLWHSVLSLKSVFLYLVKDRTLPTAMIFKEIIRNSGIATIGIALFGIGGYLHSNNDNLIIYAVLGLAVLTTSHMQIMHQMYVHLKVIKTA